MTDFSVHLAPNAPWLLLALASLVLVALAVWAYRFALPPLGGWTRRALTLGRAAVFLVLAWLLAQPVLERALGASGRRVVVLVDRSASMDLAASAGGPPRAAAAEAAARAVAGSLRGRARVETRGFASALQGDTLRPGDSRQATALGDALAELAALPMERRPDGVVVVSDGVVNAGGDPVAAARALGVPVSGVLVGASAGADRAVAGVEASAFARVGEATPVRVRVWSSEPRGTPIGVRLIDGARELARTTVSAPGPGAEALASLSVVPVRAGLAVWSARVDSLRGDAAPLNDAREVAVPVAPGKLGVLIVSAGLQWDLTSFRRALLGDSTVTLDTRVRERSGWRSIERARGAEPSSDDLRGIAVVVLDGVSSAEVSPAFDAALAAFLRGGGGLLVFSGPAPGLARFARGALGRDLAVGATPGGEREARPQPTPAAGELLAWDDDPARGAQAWRTAAPLAAVQSVQGGAGDRVLIESQGGGAPLVFSRRAGRGPVLVVNGTGTWRWTLSATDEFAAERGARLWRRAVRWLSEPVQGEPLRVLPERWMSAGGERVRLLATLQDDTFRPVAGAAITGEASDGAGHTRALVFAPGEPGSYAAALDGLGAGRWQVSVRASKAGRELGRSRSEFAVDRWSLEGLRADPDSTTLAAIAQASGGAMTRAADAGRWAGAIETRALVRRRASSLRLWESPWLFALVVAALTLEWTWRRRRGLP